MSIEFTKKTCKYNMQPMIIKILHISQAKYKQKS